MSFLSDIRKFKTVTNTNNNSNVSTLSADMDNSFLKPPMTPDTLTLDFVKQYLRVDHDLDDAEILVHLISAQQYVRTYTKTEDDQPLALGLLAPVLALTSHFYENKSPNIVSTESLDRIFSSTLDMYRGDIVGNS